MHSSSSLLLCSTIIFVFQVQTFNHQLIITITTNILYFMHHDGQHMLHQLLITSSPPTTLTHLLSTIDCSLSYINHVSPMLQQSFTMTNMSHTCITSVVASSASHTHIHTHHHIIVAVVASWWCCCCCFVVCSCVCRDDLRCDALMYSSYFYQHTSPSINPLDVTTWPHIHVIMMCVQVVGFLFPSRRFAPLFRLITELSHI